MHLKTTLCSSLALLLSWTCSAGASPPLDVHTLVERACRAPAEQRRLSAVRAAASAERRASSAAPNPRIEAQHSRTLDGPVDRETIIGLALPLVVSGRLGLESEAAAERGRELDATSRAHSFESLIEVNKLFARAVVAEARRDVLARQQAALDALATAAATLARGGETARHDALRQALEAHAHRQLLVRGAAAAAATKGALEAWLGEPVTLPTLEQSGLSPENPRTVSRSDPPSFAALRASARASALEARAARRRAIPDPEVFAGYRQIDVDGETGRGFTLAISLPLPLFDHGQVDAFRADAAAARAHTELTMERRRLDASARAERARLAVLQAELGRADRRLQGAAELREGARKLYAAGDASVVELLDAYRAAEAVELAELDTIEEVLVSRIEGLRATGGGLEQACAEARR